MNLRKIVVLTIFIALGSIGLAILQNLLGIEFPSFTVEVIYDVALLVFGGAMGIIISSKSI